MVKRMEYCRWEVANHMEQNAVDFRYTEAQFLQRFSYLANKWDVSTNEMCKNVVDILTTKGGQHGRFKW